MPVAAPSSLVDYYSTVAPFYQSEMAIRGDIPLWQGVIARTGTRSVLDLGCGDGRIARALRDIEVVGIQSMAYRLHELMAMELKCRSRAEVASFFGGLELVEPGLVRVPEWRPDSDADAANPATVWGGVARKRSQ